MYLSESDGGKDITTKGGYKWAVWDPRKEEAVIVKFQNGYLSWDSSYLCWADEDEENGGKFTDNRRFAIWGVGSAALIKLDQKGRMKVTNFPGGFRYLAFSGGFETLSNNRKWVTIVDDGNNAPVSNITLELVN